MRIAAVQMDFTLADVPGNLARMIEKVREAHAGGAKLVVFPECALTGYVFDSLDEARPYAETIPGPSVSAISAVCVEMGVYVVYGMLERDGDRIFNALALVGPKGLVGSYRKVHLPYLGIDRFTDFGDQPFAVYDIEGVKIGMNICYDGGFPESGRCMALMGADLIVLPTNWPASAVTAADYMTNTRALENTVYYAAVDRIGVERGVPFIGKSRICDPLGRTMSAADHANDAILYADIDVARARNKHLVREAGVNEVNRIADRRPEMYGTIVEPHSLKRPGR
ncbi:carbon-nitrogen hydrolase family protein [Schlesneria paludicola]|uniref:carbon-nitrogen hydrolase family protein n=1 Tax=Schlesneria paludicola TaxID=360056 RepID=UPI00029AA054|nr:carbon-nitrogen hydrolase family protein [Schlesneria paludicola]